MFFFFYFFFIFSFSFPKPVFEFQNSVLIPGTITEKIFKNCFAQIESNFFFSQCVGFCQLELMAFKETDRQIIFSEMDYFRPVCCRDQMKQNCSSVGLLKLSENKGIPIYRRLFKNEGTSISNITKIKENPMSKNDNYVNNNKNEPDFDKDNFWTFVLSNCGSTEFQLSGSLDFVNVKNVIFDKTVHFFGYMSLLFFVMIFIYIIIYHYLTCDLKKTTLNHQIFFASLILLSLYFLANLISFFVQSLTGRNLGIFIIMCSILRSLATVNVLYITLISLQYPIEVKTAPFVVAFVFMIFSSYIEINGLFSIVGKTVSGKWLFGYGGYNLSFADYLVNTFSSFSLLIYTMKTPPQEASEEERRTHFLFFLHILFIAYFILNAFASYNSLNKDIISYRNRNVFYGYIIHSSFLFLLNVSCGWFIRNFNPLGWQKLPENENGLKKDDSDLLGLANELGTSDSEPGFIPDVNLKPISKKMKMKKKSDDGFDFDDDSFLDSEKQVVVESKLD